MKQYIEIKRDCECEHAKYEITNYPREGLKRYYFKKGERYPYIEVFSNMYGRFFRIKTESGYIADILMYNAKLIKEED